jgi:hypothetical protein
MGEEGVIVRPREGRVNQEPLVELQSACNRAAITDLCVSALTTSC